MTNSASAAALALAGRTTSMPARAQASISIFSAPAVSITTAATPIDIASTISAVRSG